MTYVATANSGADAFQTSRANTKPGGVVAGDIGVFYLGRWNESASFPAVTPPAGAVLRATLALGDAQLLIYLKYIEAESSNSFSWSGSRWSGLWSMYFTDVDPGLDLATVPFQSATGTGTSITSLSVTTVANADLAWGVDCHEYSGGETHTPPTSFTERYDNEMGTAATRVSPGAGSQTASGGTVSASQVFLASLLALAPESGGGSVDLVIQDAKHNTSADSPSITQVHSLAVNDARHTTVADSPAFTQNHILAVQDARHLTSVDSPSFTQNHVLVPQDASHTTSVDNVDITQSHQLSIQEALHASVAENLNVTQNHLLIIQDTVHATQADNLDLSGSITLAIQKATHATKVDNVGITQTHEIVIHDSIIQMTSDHVILFGPPGGGPMSVSDLQAQKLPALSGITGSVPDMLFAYYGGLSGLTPIAQFSVSDHRKAYYVAQTGLPGSTNSMADLEEAFYDAQLVPAGSLADREFAYWFGL